MLNLGKAVFNRLARDKRGVSAVEFALVAPLLVGLYLGCVEISDGVGADRKITLIASTVTNLVAQSTALTSTDISNIFDASAAIIAPYSASGLTMTVSCLNVDASKNVTVKWSEPYNGATRLSGTVSIPSSLQIANSQLIYTQVAYPYKPPIGYTITGTLTLSEKMYMMPRITAPTDGTTACT